MPYCENCGPEADHLTGNCPHRFEKPKKVDPVQKALNEKLNEGLSAVANAVPFKCPICAARREKERLRKNRWREKQRSKK